MSLTKPLAGSRRTASRGRRGQSVIEFAISLPFLILIVVGTFAVGMLLDRHMTVTQLVRNAGNMFARGIDFSLEANKAVVLRAATSMNMTTNGGDGVVFLSLVVIAPPGSGNNEGLPVIAQRYVIGDSQVANSQVGSPPVNADGTVPNFFNDLNARATIPTSITNVLGANERVFVSEVFHQPKQLLFPGIVAPEMMSSIAYF